MNKELLIALMQKDLSELNVMIDGIAEWEKIPDSIARLATAKAENIVISLRELSKIQSQMNISENHSQEIPKVVPEELIEKKEQPIIQATPTESKPVVKEELELEFVDEKKTPETIYESVTQSKVVDLIEVVPSLNEVQRREESLVDSVISKVRITDLIQSISIGDRFRFQRELFSNNGEEMMQVFHDLNKMSSLEDAMNYIQKHFNWDMENESTKDFLTLLNRKFQ